MNTRTHQACKVRDVTSATADDRGLSTVEYVVLLVLIVGAAVGLWVNIRQDVHDKLATVHDSFASVAYAGAGAESSGSTGNSASPSSPAAAAATPPPAPAMPPVGASSKTKEDR